MSILDIPKIYNRFQNEWRMWTAPLKNDAWWYSKDYFQETLDAFGNASGGMKIIYVVLPTK